MMAGSGGGAQEQELWTSSDGGATFTQDGLGLGYRVYGSGFRMCGV